MNAEANVSEAESIWESTIICRAKLEKLRESIAVLHGNEGKSGIECR